MESKVAPRFGRCPYFILLDENSLEPEPIANPAANAVGGAGPEAVQSISERKVGVLITGNLGPNAIRSLHALGIKAYRFENGTVKDAIGAYKAGQLTVFTGPTVKGHHG